MKRAIRLLMILCALAAMLPSASADLVMFHWPSSHQGWGIHDIVFQTYGNGEQAVVFFVKSNGNAWIELTQTKGTCSELSYVKMFSGFKGTAKEWGKYEIEVDHAGSSNNWVYQWDDTYDNETFRLEFMYPGDYCVYVRPYTKQEMTNSYLLDQFGAWREPPQWWISTYANCSISENSPFGEWYE